MIHTPLSRRTFLGACLTALAAAGCGQGSRPLRVSAHVWPGYELLFLAQDQGWLEADIRLTELTSATDSLHALSAGLVDGAALTLDEVITARARGMDLQVVLVFNISAGADVVMARPEIGDIARLKGRRIAVEDSAVGALVLARALAEAGLAGGDVVTVQLTPPEQLAAWQAGSVDAVVTYEPVASRLAAAGAQRLIDSARLPDFIFDVLAVRSALVDTLADPLRRLIAAHFRGLQRLKTLPHDTAHRMADHLGLDPAGVLEAFRGIRLPDVAENRALLQGEEPALAEVARTVADIMRGAGLLSRPVDLDRLCHGGLLPEA